MRYARKALDLLDNGKGWYQGAAYNSDESKRCLLAALADVYAPGELYTMTEEIIKEQYPDRLAGLGGPTANFNDSFRTKFQDVERVLEKLEVAEQEIFS